MFAIIKYLVKNAWWNLIYVNNSIKQKYIKLSNTNLIVAKGIDDLCPICLDNIDNGEEYDFCKQDCNRCVHKECFSMWCTKNTAICLFCKKPWNYTINNTINNTMNNKMNYTTQNYMNLI